MLTIKAEGSAGISLRDNMIPDMVALAKRTGCRVEVRANDTLFWAVDDDTVPDLQAAYDRLYMESRIVATCISRPVPRLPVPSIERVGRNPVT